MQNGILYITLGVIWLLMTAILGKRRTLSNAIYAVIGCGGIIYGIYQIIKTASVLVIVAVTMATTAFLLFFLVFYFIRHSDKFPVNLIDDKVPEPTAEEKFMYEAYKDVFDKDKDKNEKPVE